MELEVWKITLKTIAISSSQNNQSSWEKSTAIDNFLNKNV